jgi:Ca2+-binding RTX toxin-like protein
MLKWKDWSVSPGWWYVSSRGSWRTFGRTWDTGRWWESSPAREDRLKGSRGADHLWGSSGNDRIWGSRGNDKIVPGEDNDKVYAGAGADLIYARDTEGEDYIDCGAGFDKVETIHRLDETLHNCERAPGPDRGNI